MNFSICLWYLFFCLLNLFIVFGVCLFVYEMLIPVRVMETELSPRLLEAEQW